ncbi:Pentatricopeptide repeat superfamily protein [Heracleum sosnowskyi]|uniref:Pentatricopeptide repeat superfamily protein n=1 Tax=Heracleum sosnowskyi TaxID=360622 RepID=A0AAD8MJN4_9APIA|nr:Pentatricopeptide repeat superfamily protein [Heracleum sosnowskyi]
MAQEEFQESDTIFRDIVGFSGGDAKTTCHIAGYSDYKKLGISNSFKRKNRSVPINIPEIHSDTKFGYEYDEEDDSNFGTIMPPHEILGRRITGKMAFSVCSENGRTLKGRHMCEIRNSILRLTGFLET